MPRKKAAVKRVVLPDPLYGSEQVAKFINVVMREGKKSIAERIVYDALEMLSDRLKKEHKDILQTMKKALDNVAPTVEVKSRRVGGATYPVPIEVSSERGHELARRWLVKAAKTRAEKTMALRLAAELQDAYHGRGASVKVRDDVHRMAKANQAFAHYRW
ncbi:MAG: 30S ribosomal protein S7 [Gammaproteobacteria bacterium RIFCSPHIGHO2_12_FULL_42_10]|nr:MAG: 30S ribosomal protein S7 [Gammaproteobacteria bacterium RIFCSPHIGHO2_12_FULL_42_10]